MQHALSEDDVRTMRAALLAFFDAAARPLPWRSTRDPYAVWISEVMAQQTRVETVIPYYDRWLRTFPDVDALAAAPLDDVLKAWEGLGYYSRARHLHSAARTVHERHAGRIPHAYEQLLALPGIGEYTAGAIASIAFGAHHPAVDGNVRRVLARVLDHPDPGAALLRLTAGVLLPRDRPGDFNQALMELGATVCTPRSPLCGRCPIAHACRARAAGTVAQRPRARPRRAIPTIDVATAVLRDPRGRVLVTRRPPSGLLAGMWSFPAAEVRTARHAARRALAVGRTHASLRNAPRALGIIEHVFSHRRERYHCFIMDAITFDEGSTADAAWIGEDGPGPALPRAQQRIRRLAFAEISCADSVFARDER